MLSNSLNTNEIKNAAGTEVEFVHFNQQGRTRTFAQVNEPLSLFHRLDIAHMETGSGFKRVRRSKVGFSKQILSSDGVTPVTLLSYNVTVIPVGAMVADTEVANVLAELGSFLYTTGAGTTLLFDGSGNGCICLRTGSL